MLRSITHRVEEATSHIGAALIQRDRITDAVILEHLQAAQEQLRGVTAALRENERENDDLTARVTLLEGAPPALSCEAAARICGGMR